MALQSRLSAYKDRTKAVGDVIKCLGEELIPGIRNELYPVKSSFGTPEFFSLERAAAPYFGITGVQMNGYVERDGKKYLWQAKRSKVKPTFPGKLDNMVAGGQVNVICRTVILHLVIHIRTNAAAWNILWGESREGM